MSETVNQAQSHVTSPVKPLTEPGGTRQVFWGGESQLRVEVGRGFREAREGRAQCRCGPRCGPKRKAGSHPHVHLHAAVHSTLFITAKGGSRPDADAHGLTNR